MAENGVKTVNLAAASMVDDLLGVSGASTRRIPFDRLASQTRAYFGPSYKTKAELDADLAWPAGTLAMVWKDGTVANNGDYEKTGAKGTGGWTRIGDSATQVAVGKAEAWAEEDEDTEVETGQYSARHHSIKAGASASSASADAASAAVSKADADVARTQAELAAEAAGAPLKDTVAEGLAVTSDTELFLVQTSPGVQVYRNDAGSATFRGWLGEVLFDDHDAFEVFAGSFPDGTIIRTRRENVKYEAVSSDETRTTTGGVKVLALPDDRGYLTFRQLGAAGDGVTNDRQAFLRGHEKRVRTEAGDVYYIGMTGYEDTIRIVSNSHWDLAEGQFEYDYFGCPLFAIYPNPGDVVGPYNITVVEPEIVFNGDPTGQADDGLEMRQFFNCRETTSESYCAHMLIVAADGVTIYRPRTRSKVPGPAKSQNVSICMRQRNDDPADLGERLTIWDPHIDDYVMGIHGSGHRRLEILGTLRFGRYDEYSRAAPGTFYHPFAPGHPVYASGIGLEGSRYSNQRVSIGRIVDYGEYLGSSPGGGGENCLKIRFADGVDVAGVWSRRPHGLFDGFGLRNARIGPMYWESTAVAYWTLEYDGGTGAFTVGETVTAGSGGTFVVSEVSGGTAEGTLVLKLLDGTVSDGTSLTGDGSGLAVASGTPQEAEDAYLSNSAVRLTNSPADGGLAGVCEDVFFERIVIDAPAIDARPLQLSGHPTYPHKNIHVASMDLRMDASEITTAIVEMDNCLNCTVDDLWTNLTGDPETFSAVVFDGVSDGCYVSIRHRGPVAPTRSTNPSGGNNVARIDQGGVRGTFEDDVGAATQMRTDGLLVSHPVQHFSGKASNYLEINTGSGPYTATLAVQVPVQGQYDLRVFAWDRSNPAASTVRRKFDVATWDSGGSDLASDAAPMGDARIKGTDFTDVTAAVTAPGVVTLTFTSDTQITAEVAIGWTLGHTLPAAA